MWNIVLWMCRCFIIMWLENICDIFRIDVNVLFLFFVFVGNNGFFEGFWEL